MFNPNEAKKRMKEITGKDFNFKYEGLSEKEIKKLESESSSNLPVQEKMKEDERIELSAKSNLSLGRVDTSFKYSKGDRIYEEKEYFSAKQLSELNKTDDGSAKIVEIDETEEDLKAKKAQELEKEKFVKVEEQSISSSSQRTQQLEGKQEITYQEWLKMGKYKGWISILLFAFFYLSGLIIL